MKQLFRKASILAMLLLIHVLSFGQKDKKKPNFLIILLDDFGYGDLACNGNADVQTDYMDKFAAEATRVDPFFVQPISAPTRAQLLTGRHFLKTGVWGVHGGRDYMNTDETTLAQELQMEGYSTGMIGKWHLGKDGPYLPYNRGFDESWHQTDLYSYYEPEINHNGEIFRAEGWTVDYFTDRAIDFVEDNQDSAFFLYLAYTSIHEPYHAHDSLVAKYESKGLSKSLSTLYAMTEQVDVNIGRLLARLDELELSENTVIWLFGDNGPIGNPVNMPHLTDEEMGRRNPANLRGAKGKVFDNGMRVPCFVKYGNSFTQDTVKALVNVYDIFPTVLEMAQIDRKGSKSLDGMSVLPLLKGVRDTLPQRHMVWANHEIYWPDRDYLYRHLDDRNELTWKQGDFGVRYGDYKLVRSIWEIEGIKKSGLYDLRNDPTESTDISIRYPDIEQKLESYLAGWWTDEVFMGSRSYQMPIFHIGYADDEVNYVYACAPVAIEGKPITKALSVDNWVIGDEAAEYDIHVDKAGTYLLSAHLKKGPAVGSIQITINGQSIESDITLNEQPVRKFSLDRGSYRMRVEIKPEVLGDEAVVESLWMISFRGE